MLFLGTALCILQVHAQTATATISQEFSTIENKMNLQYVLSEVDGTVYLQGRCGGESGDGRIQQVFPFDLATGVVTEKVPLFPPGQLAIKGTEPHELHACYPADNEGNMQVIYSEWIPKEKQFVTWAALYHPVNGWGKKKKLHSVEEDPALGKDFFFSSDSSAAVLLFYPDKTRKDKKVKEVEITLFDQNLDKIFSRRLEISAEGKTVNTRGVRLTKDRILYAGLRSSGAYFKYEYYDFRLDMNTENAVPEELAYFEWKTLTEEDYIQLDITNGKLVQTKINRATNTKTSEKTVEFPEPVMKLISGLNDDKGQKFLVYNIVDAGDGYLYVICGTEISDYKSTPNGHFFEYHAREIVVGLLNPDGEFEWMKMIPRAFFAKTKYNMVVPYGIVYQDHLYLVYNDNPANVNVSDYTEQEETRFDKSGVLVAKVDENGSVQRNVVASAADIKADFEPSGVIRNSVAPGHLYGLARPMPRALHGLRIVQIILQ